ncbi:transcription antitermination factor NusB [Niallia sp. Krafla_26]|uniref:transcription antitermination factor NusB n=1 Tax=Niallia sp. Krafla_26 TaxID=3064703 RepID=UPI003D1820CB
MKRRTAREKALQAIFQIDMNETTPNEAIEYVLDGQSSDEYLEKLVVGVIEKRADIDAILKDHLEKWTIDRLANVDRNILRVAIYEMTECAEDVPVNVAINEAIEIAKTFGDDESSKFINSVLSKVKQTMED